MESNLTSNSQPTTIVEPVSKQSSFLVILLSSLLIISCLIAGFFAWKTQQLVSELRVVSNGLTQTPTPTPTPNPTADWKTYTNTKYNFSLKYPNNYEIITDSESVVSFGFKFPGDEKATDYLKIFDKYQSIAPKNSAEIKISDIDAKRFDRNKGSVDSDYTVVQISEPKIELEMNVSGGGLSKVFDQILSTFKFTRPVASSSPLPVACTMEAKICPDGTAVGRSGPNCEFPSCPKPQQ